MKYTRILTVTFISVVSLVILITVSSVSPAPVNRSFPIKDISGDRLSIAPIKIENTIKVDTDKFEKVQLSAGKPEFTKTEYDQKMGANEQILQHKSLYRKSAQAISVETKKGLFTLYFDQRFSYKSKDPIVSLAKEDHSSKKVSKNDSILPGIQSNDQVAAEKFTEIDGQLYYILMINNQSQSFVKAYEINQQTLTLKKVLDEEINIGQATDEYIMLGRIVSDQQGAYLIAHTDKVAKLVELNMKQKKLIYKNLPAQLKADQLDNNLYLNKGTLYAQINKGKLYIIDAKTAGLTGAKELAITLPKTFSYISVNNLTVKDQKVYVLYQGYEDTQTGEPPLYLAVFSEKTGKNLYLGEMPSMAKNGVGEPYTFIQ
ncbi:hypothetical protein [Bacillus sp. 1P06AnD]|uniref:hypothetical protein n=1 Tax=Bacillus sp. 1P06AnD TaxID=3132208 RepID=UPI0039A127C8